MKQHRVKEFGIPTGVLMPKKKRMVTQWDRDPWNEPEPEPPAAPVDLRAQGAEWRALKRTIVALAFPVIGEVNWIAFLVWVEIHLVSGSHGMIFGLGILFGNAAWFGISYGAWSLYRHFLEREGGPQ